MNKVKIFLIAGEASGDNLGERLILAIKKQILQNPAHKGKKIELIGIGGPKMEKQGLKSLFDISELSLMGFAEVIPHIPRLLRRINQVANEIITQKPDIVLTIDAPDFSFRVMKKVNKNPIAKNIKKAHLIAPSVWAYRPKRAQKIAKLYDLLLAILPFEPPYFEKYGLKTVFIGHPIFENIKKTQKSNFRDENNIKKDEILLCLTPGSRIGEIKRILPEMIGAANILSQKYPNLVVGIPSIPKTYDLIKENLDKFDAKTFLIEEKNKEKLFLAADFAIAKSGTNTLELAMYKLPMIVVYKANYLTYLMIKIMAKVKFANIINLIFNQEIIPEMIQTTCKSQILAENLEKLIKNPKKQQFQIQKSQEALKMLKMGSKETPSDKAAQELLS